MKTKQNLVIAFSFHGIGIPLAATGLIDPIWAMTAMLLSVTAVLGNSFLSRILTKTVSQVGGGCAVEH